MPETRSLDDLPWLPADVRAEVRRAAAEARRIAGDNVRRVVLFGSYARGDFLEDESDIDVLVIVGEGDARRNRELAAQLGHEAEHGGLAVKVMTESEFQRLLDEERLFAEDVRDEGTLV